MRRILFFFLFSLISGSLLWGEKVQDALDYLKRNALTLNITANVTDSTGENLWTTNISKITVNGRSVKIKISGINVIVIADITPYLKDNDTILLVSQGEVWIGSSHSDTVQHYATIKSIPVDPGERVFFFPLGIVESSANTYTIELEIQVLLNNESQNIPGEKN